MFNEYFHGDNGAGLGATHQTGWTGVVADLIRGRPGDGVFAVGELPAACWPSGAGDDARPPSRGRPLARGPAAARPLGATPRRRRHQLRRRVGRRRRRCCCACSTTRATRPRSRCADFDAGVWHGFVPGVGPGQATGTASLGPYDPPAACAATRPSCCSTRTPGPSPATVTFGPEVLGYDVGDPDRPSTLDSAGHVPRSLVVDPAFDWGDGRPPAIRYADSVIYEVHVKGFTMTHPGVPPSCAAPTPGSATRPPSPTSSTSASPRCELLPVHQNVPEAFLVERGLTNYWGYNTIGFFAPHDGYSAAVRAGRPGGQVAEFKAMVEALHAAGLEVLLDVVYNHTAEGDHRRPDAVPPRPRQPGVLPARPGRPAPLRRHDRAAATR